MVKDSARKRQLPPLPHEHGSWVMLSVPLILGAAIAPVWEWRIIILIVAAFGFFLLRYPLMTLVQRRKQAKLNRAYLYKWAGIYGGAALVCGGWLVFIEGLWGLALMGLLGFASIAFNLWLVAKRQHMSVMGELLGIAGLALGAPMAYYTVAEYVNLTAWLLWLVNFLYFGGTVFYIKLKVRQQPKTPAPDRLSLRLLKAKACLGYQTIALTIIIALVALKLAPYLIPLALIPATIKIIFGASRWQDRQSLSLPRLGVIEIVHAVLFTALVIVAFGAAEVI